MKLVADQKRMGTRNIQYLLFDLPSDHEIEGSLATECDLISTMLANKEKAGVTRIFKYARADSLISVNQYLYEPKFVHVAGHGDENGLLMLGETITWGKVAKSFLNYVKPLTEGKQRILSLSCCCSEIGAKAFSHPLRQHFTGAYYFDDSGVCFDVTLAVWTMFYYAEPTVSNHPSVVQRVNNFLGKEALKFISYRNEGADKT